MKPRLFLSLTIAAGISLSAAIVVFATYNQWSTGTISGAKLLPELAAKADDVKSIIVGHGDDRITLVRDDERWSIEERDGYPAKSDPIRTLLVRLAQTQLVERKTRNPERYALLELEDPGKESAKSRKLQILDGSGKLLADLIVGSKRIAAFGAEKTGTYVRQLDDAQTWLTDREIDVPLDIKDWINRSVFTIEQNEIAKVALKLPGEPTLTIARADEGKGDFELVDVPDGQKPKDGTSAGSIPTAYTGIQVEDIRKLESKPVGPRISVAKLETKTGMNVTFRMRRDGDNHWLSIGAEASGDAKKAAQKINNQVADWEYKIPSWKAQALFKSPSDFFESS